MNKGLLSGILLVAGTTIGGGMLALPIVTGQGGFLPSLLLYFLCWLFMASTGLLFLELCLAYEGELNIVSLATKTLGWGGKIAAWILYLFLFYCLTVAYITGLGNLLASFSGSILSDQTGSILITVFIFLLLWAGPKVAAKGNAGMMGALFFLFFLFLVLGMGSIKGSLLAHHDMEKALIALPIAFTAFAYQGVIPTLVTLLHRNRSALRWAIVVGSFIPFITYAFWQALILGIVPIEGEHGLQMALEEGQNAVMPLRYFLNAPIVFRLGEAFAFFALFTSLIGVGLGLIDFLSDGLGVEKSKNSRFFLALFVYVPTLAISLTHPHIFLIALEAAGGIGSALLLGLLPCLMVISKRMKGGGEGEELWGSKWILALLILFVLFELSIQFGLLPLS